MAEIAATLVALAIPWIAGGAIVLALVGTNGARDLPLAIGYGGWIGAFVATLALRATSVAGIPWNVVGLDGALVLVAAIAGYRVWRIRTAEPSPPRRPAGSLADESGPMRWLFVAALTLVVVRIAGLALEVAVSPLRAYDGWAHWSTKARVWLETGRIVPFVTQDAWLASGDPGVYTDANPGHPGTVGLLQVWVARHVGGWNEPAVNSPWIAISVALALAVYSQARAAGARAAFAMVVVWLVVSLPLLGQHVAQAGAADLYMAAAYAMAAMAVWRWSVSRERGIAVLGALAALAGVWVKVEGALWMATLVPAVVVALNRRAGLALAAAAVAAFGAFVLFGPQRVPMLGYVLLSKPVNVLPTVLLQTLVLDTWHLAAYAAVAVALCRWRTLLSPRLAPATLTVAAAIGLVVVVFFFSSAAWGVADETLGNRFLLHLMPALVFYTLLVLLEPGAPAGDQPSEQATKAADA